MEPNNPYSPPKTHVEDIPYSREGATSRPREVDIAFAVILISAAIGFLSFFMRGMQDPLFTLFAPILLLGMAYAIRHRQNWARIAFLVLYLVGLPTVFFASELVAQAGMVLFIIFCIQLLIQGAAIWFMFCNPSSSWFRRPKR